MEQAFFKVTHIPDLSLSKYQTLAETGVEGVLERHRAFLRQWHRICLLNRLSMHLLILFDPALSKGQRLEVFLILQGEAENLQGIAPFLRFSPLSDYFEFLEVQKAQWQAHYQAGATLIKKERIVPVVSGANGTLEHYYFVPQWEVDENARLYDLFRMLTAIGQSGAAGVHSAYRIDLYPRVLADTTRASFENPLKELRKHSGYSGGDYIALSQQMSRASRDDNAQEALSQYEEWIEKLDTSPHFRVNIYGFSDSPVHASMVLDAVGAEAVVQGDYSLLRIRTEPEGLTACSRMDAEPREYCTFKESSEDMRSWTTTYTCDEVLSFFRFPVLFEGETIEIPKETAPPIQQRGLRIGADSHGHEVSVPIEDLVKHAFISGVPGSGKTNTMLHLASSLWKQYKVPFLVLEPAKKEYRALLNDPEMKDVILFSPGLTSRFPFKINPFQFPLKMVLSEHISALMNVFSGAFALMGPTYFFLDKSIEAAYSKHGWSIDTENGGQLPYPTMEDVYRQLEQEIAASSYDGEIKGNLKSFLQVRLGGLMRREAGDIFNVVSSTLAPEEWLERSIILELESLGEQDKNFLMLLLCNNILECLRITPSAAREAPVRHALFIEEAHNIIATTSAQENSENVNPKISATAFIVKMLAEVRALREAIIIADQLPSAMSPEVLKNTGLKLVHRLTAQDDRQMMGSTMSASSLQVEMLPVLSKGEALIFYEGLQKPFHLRVQQWGNGAYSYIPMEQEHLVSYMHEQFRFMEAYKRTIASKINALYRKEILPVYNEYTRVATRIQQKKEQVEMASKEAEPDHEFIEHLISENQQLEARMFAIMDQAQPIYNRFLRYADDGELVEDVVQDGLLILGSIINY